MRAELAKIFETMLFTSLENAPSVKISYLLRKGIRNGEASRGKF